MKKEISEGQAEDLLRAGEGAEPLPLTKQIIINEAERALKPGSEIFEIPGRPFPVYIKWAAAILIIAVIAAAAAVIWLNKPRNILLSGRLKAVRDSEEITLEVEQPIPFDHTVTAQQRSVCRLSEGSFFKIDLGTEIILHKPERGERIRLQLEKGRLFLRVAERPGKFMIYSKNGWVEVKGTIFGVEEHEGMTLVSVFKGVVALAKEGKELELTNGQSGKADIKGEPVLTDVDPNTALLWARDSAEFISRPLGEVLGWVEKNSSYQFRISPRLRNELITITIAEDPILTVIDVLFATCGLSYTVKENAVIVEQGK